MYDFSDSRFGNLLCRSLSSPIYQKRTVIRNILLFERSGVT